VVLRHRADPTRGYALRSTVLEQDGLIAAGTAVARATDVAGLRRALAGWWAPSVNFVLADRQGDIGYQLVGKAPRRPEGSGVLPALGWDPDSEWQGYLAFDELPHTISPVAGVLVSANNKPDADRDGRPLLGEWADGYRAQRILDCLARHERHTTQSFGAAHLDAVSLAARSLQDLLRDVTPRTPLAQRLWQDFLAWDGVLSETSREAALYHALRLALYRLLLASVLGPAVDDFFGLPVHPLGTSSAYQFRGSSFLLDQLGGVKRAPEGREAMSGLVTRAFETAHADLVTRMGHDETRWEWGRIHRLTLRHVLGRGPVLGRLFNRGPFPVRGDADTPHQASFSLKDPYEASRWLPTLRFIADTGDWDRSLMVHVPGQSGQVGDRHFDDQIGHWRRGEYFAMPFSREAVEAATASVQRFSPSER
jgi:penicillin amidase